MLVAGVGMGLPALWTRGATTSLTRDEFAVAAYEQRAAELKQDFEDGVIDADQLARHGGRPPTAELRRRLQERGRFQVTPKRARFLPPVCSLSPRSRLRCRLLRVRCTCRTGISGKGVPRGVPSQAASTGNAAPQEQSGMPSIEEMVSGL